MNCATFENRMAELLSGQLDPAGRKGCLAGLKEHAAGCPDCAGCDDLLQLAGRPEGERDLFDAPPADYWETFEARLHDRIARASGVTSARRHGAWIAAVAATVLAAAAGVWLLRDAGTAEPDLAVRRPPAESVAQGPLPEAFARTVHQASADEVAAELEVLSATVWGADAGRVDDDADWDTGLFPDTSGLDSEARRELLNWLREQSS